MDPASVYDRPTLDDLVGRPAWMRAAACRAHPELSWYPTLGQPSTAQKAICAGCPVADECRTYAASNDEPAGTWGGVTVR